MTAIDRVCQKGWRLIVLTDRSEEEGEKGGTRHPLSGSLKRSRWTAILLSAFAGLALLLGGVGVYGVLAYSVRQRTREIGVRLALGAEKITVWKGVVRDGMGLVLPGVILGLILSVPAVRVLDGLLYGIPRSDPITFVAVSLLLCLSGLIAVALPALRAVRIDPAIALRRDG